MSNTNITGIVIAGGKSSRMGTNKAEVNFKGKRLIDTAVQILRVHSHTILISSNLFVPNINYPIIHDEHKNIGPIGGLYTCLKASETELNLIIPCDVPNIEPHLYNILLNNSENTDAVVPRLPSGKLEPLIAIYKKSILPIIENSIAKSDYKLINLLSKIKTKYVDFENTRQFMNINTPEDL